MKHLKKLPILGLMILLFSACKKEEFESTGSLVINFSTELPCFALYTENSFSTTQVPLYQKGYRANVKAKVEDRKVTFEGLLQGNYVFSACSTTGAIAVQVVPGESKTYTY